MAFFPTFEDILLISLALVGIAEMLGTISGILSNYSFGVTSDRIGRTKTFLINAIMM
jgi:hypothetical protein